MFLAYQASMHWQIETGHFNTSSENNRIIMSDEERVKKPPNKTRALSGDKSQGVKLLQQRLT